MASSIINGTIWSFIQRFGGMAISFVSNMVLARLLCPEDFGTMGMIMVFVSLADVLVDGGLGNALIQKKNIGENDTTTVFTANMVFSIFLFCLVFVIAPFIESYTSISRLSLYLRVQSVMILTRALYTVPFSLITKQLLFQSLAKINLFASFLSVSLSILLAYNGCGIWSLIWRNIVLDTILVICVFAKSRFKIRIGFDKAVFKGLFNFGFFVVLSNIVENLYSNAITFFTGKKYSVKELGYYNQAYSLQQMPIYSMTSVLNQVLFPYFSKIQDDEEQVKDKLKTSMQLTTFFVYPVLVFLIFYAEQVITILYSEKWLPCVPYFRLFCIAGLLNAMIHINRSLLKSKGYTKSIFYIQIANTVIGIALLLICLQISMIITVIAFVVNTIILYVMTATVSGLKIRYHLIQQIKDVMGNLVLSVCSIVPCWYLLGYIHLNIILMVVLELLSFGLIYIVFHLIIKTESWHTLYPILKSFKK